MNVLVLGGTRYFGIHLVNRLLADGHSVTIATRGKTPDTFADKVGRIIIEREYADSIRNALQSKFFDVAFDNLAYCSNDVRFLLDSLHTDRYIMTSSVSVYRDFHMGIKEAEQDAKSYPLKWCSRTDFPYDEIKRQAECALYQTYPNQSSAAVRFPYVFGKDDYTKRLYFYVEHIVHEHAMDIDNPDARLSFINSKEAGDFLAWIACKPVCGCINASSNDTISLNEIINYTEKRSGKTSLIQKQGDSAPLNGVSSFSLDLSKASDCGFNFMNINEWIYPLIDSWIEALR